MILVYPLFFLVFLLMISTLIYDDTGINPYSIESYEKAQKKRQEKLDKLYEVRKMKEEDIKKLTRDREKVDEKEND